MQGRLSLEFHDAAVVSPAYATLQSLLLIRTLLSVFASKKCLATLAYRSIVEFQEEIPCSKSDSINAFRSL